ncbi:MAG: hypothetical protein WDN24_13310 [Sphingomonas sp.]
MTAIPAPARSRHLVAGFWLLIAFVLVMASWPRPILIPGNPSDKVQHIAAFVVLTVAAVLAYRDMPRWRIALTLSGFGGLIEIVQLIPALHRQSDWADWRADTAAIVVTMAVMWLVAWGTRAARPVGRFSWKSFRRG